MKLFIALALCLAVAFAAPRDKYVETSKATVTKSKSANGGLASTIATTCTTEMDAIKATIAEAEKLGGSDLVAQKTQLGSALMERIKGIEALIAALRSAFLPRGKRRGWGGPGACCVCLCVHVAAGVRVEDPRLWYGCVCVC